MISFKGILKYSIYMFIAGWMFLLGIMVGRGTSPVTFDTKNFQKRLETIAKEFNKKNTTPEKIDLKFFDVLDHPEAEESVASKEKQPEIVPKKESGQSVAGVTDPLPVKTSLKKQTFQKTETPLKADIQPGKPLKTEDLKPDQTKPETVLPAKNKPAEKPPEAPPEKGLFTIQIAAYKEFKDAVSHMALLEKKGFSAYREKAENNGVTWYRVRIGSFSTYDEAKIFNEKLNQAKIKSMIIKKDSDENING